MEWNTRIAKLKQKLIKSQKLSIWLLFIKNREKKETKAYNASIPFKSNACRFKNFSDIHKTGDIILHSKFTLEV